MDNLSSNELLEEIIGHLKFTNEQYDKVIKNMIPLTGLRIIENNEEKLLQGGFVAELVEQEGYYRYVEDQEQNLPFGGVAMNFVEFDG